VGRFEGQSKGDRAHTRLQEEGRPRAGSSHWFLFVGGFGVGGFLNKSFSFSIPVAPTGRSYKVEPAEG
jgi:hypothetical protein